jgi:hypothetical protein
MRFILHFFLLPALSWASSVSQDVNREELSCSVISIVTETITVTVNTYGFVQPSSVSITLSSLANQPSVTPTLGSVTISNPTTASSSKASTSSHPSVEGCSYWLEDIQHQGVAAFNIDPMYQVFRNVKDFGAKGALHKGLVWDH